MRSLWIVIISIKMQYGGPLASAAHRVKGKWTPRVNKDWKLKGLGISMRVRAAQSSSWPWSTGRVRKQLSLCPSPLFLSYKGRLWGVLTAVWEEDWKLYGSKRAVQWFPVRGKESLRPDNSFLWVRESMSAQAQGSWFCFLSVFPLNTKPVKALLLQRPTQKLPLLRLLVPSNHTFLPAHGASDLYFS